MANLRHSILLLLRLPLLLALSSSIAFSAQWSEMNTGLTNTDIHAVAIDPSNPAFVYAGSNGGVYGSTNGGVEWNNIGLTRVRSLAIDFTNPNILYAGTDSGPGIGGPVLFKSVDRGMTWSNRRSPLDYDFSLLAMDPTDSKTLYIGSELSSCCAGGSVSLMKTVDGGETWSETFMPGIEAGCCTLAIDPINPQNLFLPGRRYARLAYVDSGLMKSTDGGLSWTPTTLIDSVTPVNNGHDVSLVAIDPGNPKTLYAATARRYYDFAGLFKSIDAGNTWFPINTGLLDSGNPGRISAVLIDPDDTNIVYIASGGHLSGFGRYGTFPRGGVFKTIDGGKNWTAFDDGLTDLNVRALAITPGSPNILYAGTPAGVFKAIDDQPILTVNKNEYCIGSHWELTVSNSPPGRSVRLIGTSNNRSWEIPEWRQTRPDGVWRETGVFAPETEGTHDLGVEVGGVLSNVVSFVVSSCRP